MNVLAIDPGSAQPGPACAYFSRGVLVAVRFDYRPGGADCDVVVVEDMQVDERTRGIDVRHLLACQGAGMLAAGFALGSGAKRLVALTPSAWKGSEPKPIQHTRVWGVLAPAERLVLGGAETKAAIDAAVEKGAMRRWGIAGADCYPRTWKTHNLLDATALGLTHLGRLAKR